jgi:hypothetical protein
MKTKKKDKPRRSRECNTNYYFSDKDLRSYFSRGSYHKPSHSSTRKRLFEDFYPSHFKYYQQIPCGSSSNVNDIINEPSVRVKTMYSLENEELVNYIPF